MMPSVNPPDEPAASKNNKTAAPTAQRFSSTCAIAPRRRLFTLAMGLGLGPWLTIILVASRKDPPPLPVVIALILVNVVGWVVLADSLLYRRLVVIDFARRRILLRRQFFRARVATIELADVRRFVQSSTVRTFPDEDSSDDGRCYLLGVELSDGRIVQLVETNSQEQVDKLEAAVMRELGQVR